MNLVFEIYNGEKNNLIYKTYLELSKGVNYFISISYKPEEDFNAFLVKTYENDNLIHEEKIHLKVK